MRRARLIIIVSLAAFCLLEQRTGAQQIENVRGSPIPGVAGYGVDLGLNGSGDVAGLIIYKGTAVAQELPACTPQPVPRSGDVGTIATTDFNFDRYGDLALQVSSKDGNATFCVWLFDSTTKQYVASPALSQLTNPRADPKTKTVVANKNMGCNGSCYDKQAYQWSNGQLTMIRDESVTRNIEAQTGYTGGCSFVKSIKEVRNGKLTETSRNTVNDVGALCGAIQ
jgi:hypothetical protein